MALLCRPLLQDLVAPAPPPREQQPIVTAGTVAVTQDALIPGGSIATGGADAADQLAAALAPQGSRCLGRGLTPQGRVSRCRGPACTFV